jgi:CO/xanthine dehydrogenase Mo-binding subunit
LEPRGCIAQYMPASEEYTVWMTSQDPHIMRLLMTAFVFGIPETKMRVIAPVGGGFGTKGPLPWYCLITALTRKRQTCQVGETRESMYHPRSGSCDRH